MRRGEWLPTYDTLKVNCSGGLMDGQHRLQAVIRSGWTGPMLVVTGVPDVLRRGRWTRQGSGVAERASQACKLVLLVGDDLVSDRE